MSGIAENLTASIAAAATSDTLDALSKLASEHWGSTELSDAAANALYCQIADRRKALRPQAGRPARGKVPATLTHALDRADVELTRRTAPQLAHRDGAAFSGRVPGWLFKEFGVHLSIGNAAVVATIGEQIAVHGRCDLRVEDIARIAGVSRSTAQRGERKARAIGFIVIDVRKVARDRNLPNVIRLATTPIAARWSDWLAVWLEKVMGVKAHDQVQGHRRHVSLARGGVGVRSDLQEDTQIESTTGEVPTKIKNSTLRTPPPAPEPSPPPAAEPATEADKHLAAQLESAAGPALGSCPAIRNLAEPRQWLAQGCDLALDVLAVIKAKAASKAPGSIVSWRYFSAAVIEARDRRLKPVKRRRRRPSIIGESSTRAALDILRGRENPGSEPVTIRPAIIGESPTRAALRIARGGPIGDTIGRPAVIGESPTRAALRQARQGAQP